MRALPVFSAFLLLGVLSTAQDSKPPEFEVASIKPSAPDARYMRVNTMPGGRITITHMTLKDLIVFSYRVQPYQVSGGPPWLDSLHWDVEAKSENQPKQGEVMTMLQKLLADRFQLTMNRETKDLPIYALVLARKDGTLGPKLFESKEGTTCVAVEPNRPPPPPEPGQPRPNYCGRMMMQPRALHAISVPVSQIAPMLAQLLGRTVVDKTGLTAKYNIDVEWTPDEAMSMQFPSDGPKPAPAESTGPSIFTALQEQLGLKLESQKGPVEMLSITRAEKPSEN